MNEQQRQLRLQEITPIKKAMMAISTRADHGSPPIHTHKPAGYDKDHSFEDAIKLFSVEDGGVFEKRSSDFLKKAEDASHRWFTTRKTLPEEATLDQIKANYRAMGGDKLISELKALYVELSRHLEDLLK